MSDLEEIIEQETRKIHSISQLNQGFQRFYSYPPVECEHPWILRKIGEKEIPYEHEIVDIGIYDLLKSPDGGHSDEKLKAWEQLKTDGWKVVPDCPDLEREFEMTVICDNVSYSWELLKEYFNPDDSSHLPVIQSWYGDILSFQAYIKDFKREYGEHDKIGVGSIFKADTDFAVRMLKIARREFPNSWIHAFGLKFKHFIKVRQIINSFDSTGWTRDIEQSGKSSAKNKMERIHYFNKYINRLNEVMCPYNQNQTKLKV
jgi:hypothetical protein